MLASPHSMRNYAVLPAELPKRQLLIWLMLAAPLQLCAGAWSGGNTVYISSLLDFLLAELGPRPLPSQDILSFAVQA